MEMKEPDTSRAAEILTKFKTSAPRQIIVDVATVDRAVTIIQQYSKSNGGTQIGQRLRQLASTLWEQWHTVDPDDLRALEGQLVDAVATIVRASLGGVFTETQLKQLLDPEKADSVGPKMN